tara:strand:+ start:251 stop:559 length:309 start_codon:yes stop_codon:yes gene_type:complete
MTHTKEAIERVVAVQLERNPPWQNPGLEEGRAIVAAFTDAILTALESAPQAGGDVREALEETAKNLSHKIGDFTQWEYVPGAHTFERWLKDSSLFAALTATA